VTHDEPVSRFRQIGMAAVAKTGSSRVVILLPTAVSNAYSRHSER
jgi:hypothetical protein